MLEPIFMFHVLRAKIVLFLDYPNKRRKKDVFTLKAFQSLLQALLCSPDDPQYCHRGQSEIL